MKRRHYRLIGRRTRVLRTAFRMPYGGQRVCRTSYRAKPDRWERPAIVRVATRPQYETMKIRRAQAAYAEARR